MTNHFEKCLEWTARSNTLILLRLVVTLMLLGLQPVLALIVVDGKVVSEWPPEADQLPGTQGALEKTSGLPTQFYPHPTGTVWGLTLLVDFSDQPANFTKAQIDAWLNLPGYNLYKNPGSVRDYWTDVSNGKVDYRNEIYGFYRAKKPKSYYEGLGDYSGATELLTEVLNYFDATVDFSKFDNDKSGSTESISIAYAGEMVAFGKGLWPHAGGTNENRDGVRLSKYMMTNLGTELDLMTFCHEVGHLVFGWPDLYGFGDYCLMGNAYTRNPVPINDFYRADQGWIDIIDIDKNMNAFYKAPANSKSGFRYLNPDRPGECFFWSNWKNVGRRAEIKGSGILMLHFDYEIRRNNPPNTLSLSVVQADGKGDLNKTQWPTPGTDPYDYFYKGNGTTFGSTSVPAAKWNNGTTSGLVVHDIGPILDTMTFYVGTGLVSTLPGQNPAAIDVAKAPGFIQFDIQGRNQGTGLPEALTAPTIWRINR